MIKSFLLVLFGFCLSYFGVRALAETETIGEGRIKVFEDSKRGVLCYYTLKVNLGYADTTALSCLKK